MKLLSLSPLQFTGEGISGIGDQISQTFGADAVPTKGDRRLLFEQIGRGDSNRVKRAILCDKPFHDIICGMAGVGIEYLNTSRFVLLRDEGPSAVEDKHNVRSAQILIFG